MSRRDNVEARCAVCRMHATLCICALVPRLRTRTRLAVLVHYREARKPSNTGQLAARCLERGSVQVFGRRGQVLKAPAIGDDELPLLLFPDEDAAPISQYAASEKPIVLIVPDGNWRQASKVRRRVPELSAIPCVTLPAAGPTEYRLRAEPREGGLATLEAIARAFGILEGDAGPETERAMLAVFRVMVERTLWFRGKLHDHEVTGGIPEAARVNDPRGAVTKQSLYSASGARAPGDYTAEPTDDTADPGDDTADPDDDTADPGDDTADPTDTDSDAGGPTSTGRPVRRS